MATKPNKPSVSWVKKPKSEDQLWGAAKPVRQKAKKAPASARAASQASRAMVKKENRPAAAAQAKAYNKTLKKVKGDATKIPGFTMGRNTY